VFGGGSPSGGTSNSAYATTAGTDGAVPYDPSPTASAAAAGQQLQIAPSSRIAGSITDADYPASAIRTGAQGLVRVRLTLAPNGAVTGCSILSSSGNSALDATTCALMQRRFRYAPSAQTSVEEAVTWSLPR
jgi:TonB family protein